MTTPNHAIQELDQLKKELVGLFGHIQSIRRELAAIQTPHHEDEDRFAEMADQLDAIVEATEGATNTIMSECEEINDLIAKAEQQFPDPKLKAVLDKVTDKCNTIFEACSFQDLTGQRVTKVVRSVKFIEERINAVIRMWGKDELAKMVDDLQQQQDADPDKKLLHGPQRTGVAITQEDVDKLFSQADIDKLFD